MCADGQGSGGTNPEEHKDRNSGFAKIDKKRKHFTVEMIVLILIAVAVFFGSLWWISTYHPVGATLPVNNTSSAMLNGTAVPAMPQWVTITWVQAWVVVVALLFVFIAALGWFIYNRFMGIFINENNVMSLSRLQITLWTVIIVPALLIMVIVRSVYGVPDPFAIIIDWHVWAV